MSRAAREDIGRGPAAQAQASARARSLRQGMPMQRGRAETDLSSIVLVLLCSVRSWLPAVAEPTT